MWKVIHRFNAQDFSIFKTNLKNYFPTQQNQGASGHILKIWIIPRGSAKASFGVPDSPKFNLDPLFQKLVPARGFLRTHISNVVMTWTKVGLNQSLLPTPKLPFYEHFDCFITRVLTWLGLQYFIWDPLLFHFLLVRGSMNYIPPAIYHHRINNDIHFLLENHVF